MTDILLPLLPWYLFGALGTYYTTFRNMDSQWKYVLPFFWPVVWPLIGLMVAVAKL